MTPNDVTVLELKAHQKIEWCIARYNRYNPSKPFTNYIKIDTSLRGNVAGRAISRINKSCIVRVNLELLIKYRDEYIADTIVHEVAHILAFHENPHSAPHGNDWYVMMNLLGHEAPSRCHNMEKTPARQIRKWKWTCNCGFEHLVAKAKHQRMLNGASYYCVHCKSKLRR